MHLEWFWCNLNGFPLLNRRRSHILFESRYCPISWEALWAITCCIVLHCHCFVSHRTMAMWSKTRQHCRLTICWYFGFWSLTNEWEVNPKKNNPMMSQNNDNAKKKQDCCWRLWWKLICQLSNTFPAGILSGIILHLAFFCFRGMFWTLKKVEITYICVSVSKKLQKEFRLLQFLFNWRECCSRVYFIDSFCVNFKIQLNQE